MVLPHYCIFREVCHPAFYAAIFFTKLIRVSICAAGAIVPQGLYVAKIMPIQTTAASRRVTIESAATAHRLSRVGSLHQSQPSPQYRHVDCVNNNQARPIRSTSILYLLAFSMHAPHDDEKYVYIFPVAMGMPTP